MARIKKVLTPNESKLRRKKKLLSEHLRMTKRLSHRPRKVVVVVVVVAASAAAAVAATAGAVKAVAAGRARAVAGVAAKEDVAVVLDIHVLPCSKVKLS